MGSPSYCYREFMREYIRVNVTMSKLSKVYTEEYVNSLSEEELEKEVRKFNRTYKAYGAFLGGVAVAHCIEEWNNSCDMLNASAGAIGGFQELLGIYEPNDVDFEED